MGIDDRDYDYRSRGDASRRRGSYEGSEPPAGRSSPRGRPPRYDDDPPSRGPSRRDFSRDDDPRSSSGSRYDRGGNDRRPQSGSGRRPRSEYDDDTSMRRDRRPPDQYGRTGRGPRPSARDDWETSGRPRNGRGPAPADSGARHRRGGAAVASPRGGGLWGDDTTSGASARRMMDPRDPRAARRGMAQVEEEETSGAATFGKAILAIVLALIIGAGAAYGYYLYSAPKLPANVGQPSSSPTSGASGSTHVNGNVTSERGVFALSAASFVFVSGDGVVRG